MWRLRGAGICGEDKSAWAQRCCVLARLRTQGGARKKVLSDRTGPNVPRLLERVPAVARVASCSCYSSGKLGLLVWHALGGWVVLVVLE